jgi:hypothetical protein
MYHAGCCFAPQWVRTEFSLRIYTSEQRNFSDDEYELISGLADMGGIAIDNAMSSGNTCTSPGLGLPGSIRKNTTMRMTNKTLDN